MGISVLVAAYMPSPAGAEEYADEGSGPWAVLIGALEHRIPGDVCSLPLASCGSIVQKDKGRREASEERLGSMCE